MAAGDMVSRVHHPRKASRGLTRALLSAVSEWLLIFLLFIHSMFSYLITKFACHCELQTPCILCSRLDHVMSKKNMKYYWDLVCRDHKLEISSSIFCHAHNKLVDVHGICESCLFSFATINKSNAETYRLLVGKLGEESEFSFDHDPLLDGHEGGHLEGRRCSCCNQPLVLRGSTQNLVLTKSLGSETAKLDVSLPEHNQDDFVKIKSPSVSDPLFHVGYSELKITSDTDSEAHFSDEDNDAKASMLRKIAEEDLAVHSVRRIITLSDDPALEKLIDPILVAEPSHFLIRKQSDTVESDTCPLKHGLEELSWEQADHNAEHSTPTELISPEDDPLSSHGEEAPIIVPKESIIPSIITQEPPFDTSNESEPTYSVLPPIAEETPVGVSKNSELSSRDAVTLSDPVITAAEISNSVPSPTELTSTEEYIEICKVDSEPIPITETAMETNIASSGCGLQSPTSLDLSDAYKLAVSNNVRQSSGLISKDSSKLSEELKHLLSQLSVTRGFEFSMNDINSPRVSFNGDEFKTSDFATSPGLRMLQKIVTLERNESGLSLDGSIVSEIEGESAVDRLKRQVEHDRKLLSALYKELEEERNSSTISANQAMAMITRLQEEKAAFQMEALQNLRMMEEQAEYDMDAFNQVNNLLSEREKEIQDLEAELEFYRNNNNPSVSMFGNIMDTTCDLKVRDITIDHPDGDRASFLQKLDIKEPGICHESNVASSLLELEDERLYISQRLQKLEKMLNVFSGNDELHSNIVDREYSCDEGDSSSEPIELNSITEEAIKTTVSPQLGAKENSEVNLASLGNEVSELNDKMEALKADWTFLKHAIHSLRNGDEGLRFIQEIASHLQELRSIGIRRRRNQTVAS